MNKLVRKDISEAIYRIHDVLCLEYGDTAWRRRTKKDVSDSGHRAVVNTWAFAPAIERKNQTLNSLTDDELIRLLDQLSKALEDSALLFHDNEYLQRS